MPKEGAEVKPKNPRKTTLWYLGEILRVVEEIAEKANKDDPIKPTEVVPPATAPYGPPTRTIPVYGTRSRDSTSTDFTNPFRPA
jgi:hypothetical protein